MLSPVENNRSSVDVGSMSSVERKAYFLNMRPLDFIKREKELKCQMLKQAKKVNT